MPGIFIALYAIAQIVASLQGLETYLGVLGALFIIAACLYFRFTLPLTIAAFLCAKNVWGWHWFFALIFVAPGLAFLLPAIAALVITALLALMPMGKARARRPRPVDVGIIEGEYEEVFDPAARPASHARLHPEPERATPTQDGWHAAGNMARRGAKSLGYVALVIAIAGIIVFAIDRSRQPDLTAASYNGAEPINDVADYGGSADVPMVDEATTAAFVPALDNADLHGAVNEFDRVYTASGMSGAMDYSRDCHNRLALSHVARDFDQCIGFDWVAAMVDDAVTRNGMPANAYFRAVVADDSQQAAARLVSDDAAVMADRIQRIRAGTADALAQLAAAKTAGSDQGVMPDGDMGGNSGQF